jgi:hypothetical protein
MIIRNYTLDDQGREPLKECLPLPETRQPDGAFRRCHMDVIRRTIVMHPTPQTKGAKQCDSC